VRRHPPGSLCSSASVLLLSGDNDKDGIVDPIDYDDDNDGIPDYLESNVATNQNGLSDDSDGDGIPNNFDIDSDNDGITDNIEAQNESEYIPPSGIDENRNGWDDSYDTFMGGVELIPVDLDLDGVSDFLDLDTDNDGVLDEIEGNDANADGIADILKTGFDEDNDGLDDAYDNWLLKSNATGSISPLQDTDNDGTRDWRDNNDDDDSLLTFDEDTNGDGDYSNDDSNGNGIPDYLDPDDVCKLILPNGFSPNDDGINDLFKIACLHNYPNAKMEIYNRWGNMVYEKEQYGNEDIWGTIEAWWDGRSTNNLTVGSERLPPATYFYLLNLNDGSEAKTGFVFLNR
jgi:gliding motility-associated-like protein